jgi:PAS domain S-box-containing protein
MAIDRILFIGSESDEDLAGRLERVLQREDLTWSATTAERWRSVGDQRFDVVLIGARIQDPIPLAREVHAAVPAAHLLLLVEDPARESLEKDLRLVPRLGSHWSVAPVEREGEIPRRVEKALTAARSRRSLKTTLDRMNLQLSERIDPMKVRRLAASDRYLASILAHAFDAILAIDPSGEITDGNRAAEQMFGRSTAELRRLSLLDLLSEETREEALRAIGRTSPAEGEIVQLGATGAAGKRLELEASFSTVGGKESDSGISVILRDVTQRNRLQRGYEFLSRASAALFSSLDYERTFERVAGLAVESICDYCIIDLLDGKIIQRKAVASRIPAALPLLEEMREKYGPTLGSDHLVSRVIESGRTFCRNHISAGLVEASTEDERHLELVRELNFRSFISAPLIAHGTILGALTLIRRDDEAEYDDKDVEMAEELAHRTAIALTNARLYEEAERASRLKDEFLATLSHELRTPMTSILGWSRMLEVGGLDRDSRIEAIQSIRRGAQMQAQLIDDLLDISRITHGKLRVEAEQVDLEPILRAAIATIETAARAKKIDIRLEIDAESRTVYGDPSRLQQVFWNLLSNAVKFTPKEGWVRVVLDETRSMARIRVTDSGEGIAQDDLPLLFERFRQLDSSSTRGYGGLGLGLSIVRHIVELHGGEVDASSEGRGRGATFTVLLPFAAVLQKTEEPLLERSIDEVALGEELPSLEGLRILVVDDDPEARRMISAVLERAGAEVFAAPTVRAAFDVLDRETPDVVISDIAMPGEDGYRLIQKLRLTEAGRGSRPATLALTAFAGAEERRKILAAGFDRYQLKPVDPVELAEIVRSLGEARSQAEPV